MQWKGIHRNPKFKNIQHLFKINSRNACLIDKINEGSRRQQWSMGRVIPAHPGVTRMDRGYVSFFPLIHTIRVPPTSRRIVTLPFQNPLGFRPSKAKQGDLEEDLNTDKGPQTPFFCGLNADEDFQVYPGY